MRIHRKLTRWHKVLAVVTTLTLLLALAALPALAAPETTYDLTISTVGPGSTLPEAAVEPYQYLSGAVVDLVATADPGARFSHWEGPVADPAAAETSILMDDNKTITAVFIEQYVLTVETSPTAVEASIAIGPSGPYDPGTVVQVLATGMDGWTFSHWEGDVSDVDSPLTTITMNENKTITAFFIEPVILTVNPAVGDGTISPQPGTYGYPRTIGILYNEGFEVDNGGYVASGTANHWQWGEPVSWPSAAGEGEKCWGTNLTGNYSNYASAYLTSPIIDLTSLPAGAALEVSWLQALHIESSWYDQAIAEISIDGAPYTSMWAFAGSTTQIGWHSISYPLTLTAGSTLQLRWQIHTDYSIVYSGYYIDDVTIAGAHTIVPLEAAPAYGWEFSHWLGNVTNSTQTATTVIMSDLDEEVTAVFTPLPRNIALEVEPEAGGTVSGEGNFDYGSQVTVTATPQAGYNFVSWTEEGTVVSNSSSYTFTISEDRTLVAHFEFVDYNYSISARTDPVAGGTVSGTGIFEAGSTVILTATANPGYQFAGWWEGTTLVSTSSTYSFVASQDRTLTADFPALVPTGGMADLTVPSGRVQLLIVPGSTSMPYHVRLNPLPMAQFPGGYRSLGPIHEVLFNTIDGLRPGVVFDIPATLIFRYFDFELMGLPEGTPLRIFYYHPGAGLWVPLTSMLDLANRTVSASIGHTTQFALLAELETMERPTIDPLPEWVSGHSLSVSGNVAAGAQATLYLNDQPLAVTVDETGRFQLDITLQSGPNHFFVVAEQGNEQLASCEVRVVSTSVAFGDIAGHWANAYILELAARNITTGYPGATEDGPRLFKPNDNITRGEFVTLLMRALNLDGSTQAVTFSDAASIPSWMMGPVQAAVQAGIITGYDDNTFRPDENITRAQLAVMLGRALGLMQLETEMGEAVLFTDEEAIPAWAQAGVSLTSGFGIITGYPNGSFAPAGMALRAEAAAMIVRLLNLQ